MQKRPIILSILLTEATILVVSTQDFVCVHIFGTQISILIGLGNDDDFRSEQSSNQADFLLCSRFPPSFLNPLTIATNKSTTSNKCTQPLSSRDLPRIKNLDGHLGSVQVVRESLSRSLYNSASFIARSCRDMGLRDLPRIKQDSARDTSVGLCRLRVWQLSRSFPTNSYWRNVAPWAKNRVLQSGKHSRA